jgi:hypothetical protein
MLMKGDLVRCFDLVRYPLPSSLNHRRPVI